MIATGEGRGSRAGTYRRVGSYMRGFWKPIAGTTSLGVVGSFLVVLQPWPIKFIVDGVLIRNSLQIGPFGPYVSETTGDRLMAVAWMAGLYFLIVVSGVICNGAAMFTIARVALLMIHTLRGQLVVHMRTLSMRFHSQQSVGDSIFRAINDARSIQEVVLYGLRTFTVPVFRLLLMVVFMLLLDPLLTIVALLVGPPLLYAIRVLTKKIQQTSAESREHMSDLTTHIEQTMVAIRAVQVFGQEGNEQEKFNETSKRFIAAQLRFRGWEQLLQVMTVVITGVGSAGVLLLASRRVITGSLTVGSLWIFVSYMQSLYNMMNDIMFVWGPFQDAVVGVGRAFEVLDLVPDIREAPDAKPKPTFDRDLALRRVVLEYEPGRPVLDGIDLVVPRGEKVAVVGETGSGKTSLLSLLPRLYDVTDGTVEVDGIDVRDIKLADLRGLISMVPQEALLFSATIRENILYGRMDASQEEIEAAARAARAEGFILDLPDGYETAVGERGVRLSTGQQQRISIARAFLKNAPILLLDEPTSALDLHTEADFLDGLDDLMVGRTVFIVAHRLSTIRTADRICLLAGGRIVEQGSHGELMASRGRYHDLYMRQFGSSPEAEPVGR